MHINKLAATAVFAIAVTLWAAPRLAAQSASPAPTQDVGQHGEYNGDHQDTGAAAIDGKGEPAERGELGEGRAPEARSSEPEATSLSPGTASPEQDRLEDSRADSVLDHGQRGEFTGNHQDTGAGAAPHSR